MRYFFVKDKIAQNEVKIMHCPTESMWADVLTKPWQGKDYQMFRSKLMNVPVNWTVQEEIVTPIVLEPRKVAKQNGNHRKKNRTEWESAMGIMKGRSAIETKSKRILLASPIKKVSIAPHEGRRSSDQSQECVGESQITRRVKDQDEMKHVEVRGSEWSPSEYVRLQRNGVSRGNAWKGAFVGERQ